MIDSMKNLASVLTLLLALIAVSGCLIPAPAEPTDEETGITAAEVRVGPTAESVTQTDEAPTLLGQLFPRLMVLAESSDTAVVPPAGVDSWLVEGANPQRSRSTAQRLPPPLHPTQRYQTDSQTSLGSPVLVTDRQLFVEGQYTLYTFSLAGDRPKWQTEVPGSYLSPLLVGDKVVVRAERGEAGYLIAYQADSGAEAWRYKFPVVGSEYDDFGGHVSAPLLVDGLILSGASRSVRALDAVTGHLVWLFATQEPLSSAAAAADGAAFFADFTTLYAVDLPSGAERWRFATGDDRVAILFAPVISGELVVTTSFDTAYALDRSSGALVWQASLSGQTIIPAGADADYVYLKTTQVLLAVDRASGATAWTYRAPTFVSLPAITVETLYVVGRGGGQSQLRAIRRTDGQEIWRGAEIGLANAAPVLANGRVYVRLVDGGVLAYGAGD